MPTILSREVGPIGYGLMSLTMGAPASLPSEEQAFAALRTAADSGSIVWDGAEFYGAPSYNSLVLLNRFFTKYPEYADKVVINIKGAMKPNWTPDGTSENIRRSVENCVDVLGPKGNIHMFECGRRDMKVPLEDQITTLKTLVEEGKIGSVALTEVNANTIREAAKMVKISAVEVELSIWNTGPLKNGIVQACAELDIPILAYSPLGSAMLTGTLRSPVDIPEGDHRRMFPKYQDGNFQQNVKLVNELGKVATQRGCTVGQVALGWLVALSRRPDMPTIIPIPGSKSVEHVKENAVVVDLTNTEMDRIDAIISDYAVVGDRFPSYGMALTDM
ncbi:Aldo/keto reductase [Lophiostoma macrostomum CBS 122681]|uniref:Aldo/keto reductase n=1 Tax=Lophiostoma macrostomum CBS 122681 TaxID=1314788 RepID=A0A6A6TC03_9PLEO|nr:Aldo/keto reductase [Lophiostoma macrostomum CBS 122681]